MQIKRIYISPAIKTVTPYKQRIIGNITYNYKSTKK